MECNKVCSTCASVIEDRPVSAFAESFWLVNESRCSSFDIWVLASGESPYGRGRWRGEWVAELL